MTARATVFNTIEAVPAEHWDRIVDVTGAPVFYRTAYLAAYERTPLGPVEAAIYIVVHDRHDGELIAVCPATLQRPSDPLGVLAAGFPGIDTDRRMLLTHVWHCYDTWLPATRADATACIVEAMHRVAADLGAAHLGFVNVADDRLVAELHALGFTVATASDERFRTELRDVRDLDGYLARLDARARANLRRYARRARERGVTARVVPADVVDLDRALHLVHLTAARHGNEVFFPDGSFQSFIRALGERVVTIEVRRGKEAVAVGFCLLDDDRFHLWTCGVDYEAGDRFSPYGLLFSESVRAAIAAGSAYLEGGRRNREYKQRHGLERVALSACLADV